MAKRSKEDFLLKLGNAKKTRTNLRRHTGYRFLISYVFPLATFLLLMAFASSQSGSSFVGTGGIDLSPLHTVEYFVLSTLIFRLLVHLQIKGAFPAAILVAMLVGIIDELFQASVPMRTASIIDVLYDSAGASLILFFKRFPRLLF